MMTIIFKILLSVMTSLSWSGPLVVRNGAGQAEFYLVYAQKHHADLIALCSSQSVCSSGIQNHLTDLLKVQIPAELELEFVSSAELGASVYEIKSPRLIRFNKDLLFKAGGTEAWSYADAVKFFVFFRGLSLKWDVTTIKSVADRLADFIDVTQERSMNPDYRNLSLILFKEPVSSVVIEDNSLASDYAMTFEIPWSQVSCQKTTQSTQAISNASIVSARWMSSDPRDNDVTTLGIVGLIRYSCLDANGVQQIHRSRYQVKFQALRRASVWNIKPETMLIVQTEIE